MELFTLSCPPQQSASAFVVSRLVPIQLPVPKPRHCSSFALFHGHPWNAASLKRPMQPSSHTEECNLTVNHVKTIHYKIYGLRIYLQIWINVCMYLHLYISFSTNIDREVNVSQKGKTNKIFEVLLWPSSLITTEILTNFVLLSQKCFPDKRRGNRQEERQIGRGTGSRSSLPAACSPEHCKWCVLDPHTPGCCNRMSNNNKKKEPCIQKIIFYSSFQGIISEVSI